LIINVRGTHGSGKSTIMKTLIDRYKAVPESLAKNGRPLNYLFFLHNKQPVYVVGSYVTACGGCDGIQPYADIWPRVERLATLGHVLFEGALISNSYGNIGRASEIYGKNFVFAFMDTPLEVCLSRVQARRTARGDVRPLNPKNTADKHKSGGRLMEKIRNEHQRRVVQIDHKNAVSQVLRLLYHG